MCGYDHTGRFMSHAASLDSLRDGYQLKGDGPVTSYIDLCVVVALLTDFRRSYCRGQNLHVFRYQDCRR